MTKEKKTRKKAEIPEDETKNQKFHRIVTNRCKLLGKAYNLITRLPKQPSYAITQDDAKKLIEWINVYHDLFLDRYTPLANGELISHSGEQEFKEVF